MWQKQLSSIVPYITNFIIIIFCGDGGTMIRPVNTKLSIMPHLKFDIVPIV